MSLLTLQISIIALMSIFAQWVAWRVKVPAIVFLLAIGFVLGPVANVIQPDVLLGDLLKPAIAAAVAIILFEGSLQLNFKELRDARHAIRHILIFGTPLMWALISCAAHYIVGLEWAVSVVLGGILIVTGPTVVIPMLRQARLNHKVSAVLKWEGIVNDCVGIVLAVLAYEYFLASETGEITAGFFGKYLGILALIIVGSFMLGRLINRLFERGHMPEYLKAPFLFSVVISVFFACNALLYESGLIAVTVLGITLANTGVARLEEIKRFKETVTIMLVSGLFILLTADLELSVVKEISWHSFAFIFCLLFLIRPFVFWLCTLGTGMTWQEKLLTGMIAPRGIVCAAMAGVIGPLLVNAGFEDGEKILPLCFAIVAVSVVLHSFMIRPLAKALDLTAPRENGIVIVGANEWTTQLAQEFNDKDVPVLIIDDEWRRLAPARMAGVTAYYGEILSEETQIQHNMLQYDIVLIATPDEAYNGLVAQSLSHEYGSERVLNVHVDDQSKSKRRQISDHEQGHYFVSEELTDIKFTEQFEEGWRFKIVNVTTKQDEDGQRHSEEEGHEDDKETRILYYPKEDADKCLHAGKISEKGVITLYFNDNRERPKPKEGERLIIWCDEDKMDV